MNRDFRPSSYADLPGTLRGMAYLILIALILAIAAALTLGLLALLRAGRTPDDEAATMAAQARAGRLAREAR